jgi:hypothetical protein
MPPKYGRELWTPAMQAGIVQKRLTFRQIFTMAGRFLCVYVVLEIRRASGRLVAQDSNSG